MKTKPKTLKNLIEAGKFDYVNSDIEPNFPLEEARSNDYKLFYFGHIIISEDAIGEMEKAGYLPATATELLLYAQDGWNGEGWVVALGSVADVRGTIRAPCLGMNDPERGLHLIWSDFRWDAFCRFLGVRSALSPSNSLTLPIEAEIPEYKKTLKHLLDLAEKVGRQAALEEVRKKIGMLRQWLNEDRISDHKLMVTNDDICFWLFPRQTGNEK